MQVGITGGIGAGKTTACKIFKVLGIPVYEADVKARQLMEESSVLKQRIISKFGDSSYLESGLLNREYLGKLVFPDPQKVEELNKLVHPMVARDYGDWVRSNLQFAPYVLKEAALLVETGSYEQLDHLIMVVAPLDLRISRVLKRDSHRTSDQIKTIIKAQLSDLEKIEVSDFVLYNDEQQLLIPQVLKIHNRFISREG